MPYLVAIIGRPNSGKSTLFNRLTKTRKAIVDPTPGVTRDRNYGEVTCDEKSFILVDTGGVEPAKGDKLVSKMLDQTTQAIEEADVIIFLMDGKTGLTAADHSIIDRIRKISKPVFFAVNKIDGPKQEELLSEFYQIGVDQIYPVSAEHGYGIRDLMSDLVSSIPEQAERIDEPNEIKLAFIGRPNSGKSSLVNRLLGEERMLVTEIPGTTRDSVDSILEKDGRRYRIIDTAGIRKRGRISDRIEKYSVIKALKSLAECDIALAVIDAGLGITDQDTHVLGYTADSGRGCVVLINKWDLIREEKERKKILEAIRAATDFIAYAPILKVSALTGYKVNDIFKSIDSVYEQCNTRISTGKLNQALREMVSHHPPPSRSGRHVKLFYMTEISVKPPTFVIFTNSPDEVHFSYRRYLANQLREKFPLSNAPLKFIFRKRESARR